MLLKYFDAMLYAANWGSRRVAFRFPAAAIDAKAIQAYCVQYRITLTRSGKYQVLDFELSEEEGGDWVDVEGVLWRLIPVREQIMQGDYRALYLAACAGRPAQAEWRPEGIHGPVRDRRAPGESGG